jgi:hypothetical protein
MMPSFFAPSLSMARCEAKLIICPQADHLATEPIDVFEQHQLGRVDVRALPALRVHVYQSRRDRSGTMSW